jgi:hypothetical protein
LIATSSATAGHPATSRPTGSDAPTATFAATPATVPAASAAHGNHPARVPARRCANSTNDATISIPSTETGNA